MTDRLVIHLDRERTRWLVQRHGDFPRHVASFDSLHEAEQYVLEHGEPV